MRHQGSAGVLAARLRKIIGFSSLVLTILAVLFLSGANRDLVDAGTLQIDGPRIGPSGSARAERAAVMSAEQMEAYAGNPLPPPAEVNRPTIPLDEYNAAKAEAALSGTSKPLAQGAASSAGPLVSAFTTNFQGAVQGENGRGFIPPDVDAAVGPSQSLQPTNSSLDVFNKSGTHLRSISQNGFVGNFTDALGDGRAMYDPNYNRWVVLIDDFSNLTNSGKPNYHLAVSQTSDATGAYLVFAATLSTNPAGQFFDYPQLGMDQDALLITANMFNGSTGPFIGPIMFAIPKAKAYNGFGFSAPLFAALSSAGTIAPPFVLDNNGKDFFVSAPVGSAQVALDKFTMTDGGRSTVAVSGPVSIPLPNGVSYSTPPPDAKQTCTGTNPALTLDSLDGRFQNRSYQFGTALWQIHTVTTGSFPIPRFYQLNTNTNTTVQTGAFFLSGSSFDFNPSIAANTASSAMVTWSATDPTNAKDAQVMFGGRTSATALNTMPVGGSVASSTTCLVDNFSSSKGKQRWGDYSVTNLDGSAFWITNEKVIGNSGNATDTWATQITRVTP